MTYQNDYYAEVVAKLDKELPTNLIFAEVGTAHGTTAMRAIQALNHSKRWFFTIDPYGDKPYSIADDHNLTGYDYNDTTYRETMALLASSALAREVHHLHWKLRSHDFIVIFPQVEFWGDGHLVPPEFGLAYLDGEHSWRAVGTEFVWFYAHMPAGGVIAIDDYNLLGGEEAVRAQLGEFEGEWFFNEVDAHYRCYFTKS